MVLSHLPRDPIDETGVVRRASTRLGGGEQTWAALGSAGGAQRGFGASSLFFISSSFFISPWLWGGI